MIVHAFHPCDLGQRIAYHRTRLRMSTHTLGQHIGKSMATISRIEHGKQGVDLALFHRIADALGVHPFTLLTDASLIHAEWMPPDHPRPPDSPSTGLVGFLLGLERRRAGLSVEDVAHATRLAPDTLDAMEKGTSLPDDASLPAIAQFFGLDVDELAALADLEHAVPDLAGRIGRFLTFHWQLWREWMEAGWVHEARRLDRMAFPSPRVPRGTDARGGLAENLLPYFSLRHVSDTLLQALQDPAFHAQTEERAAAWAAAAHDADAPATDPALIPPPVSLIGQDAFASDIPPDDWAADIDAEAPMDADIPQPDPDA